MWAPPTKDRKPDMCDLRGADAILAGHALCSSALFLNASPSSSYHRIIPSQRHVLSARYHHHNQSRRAHYSLSPKLSQASYRSSAAFSTSNGSLGNESRKHNRLMIRGGIVPI